MYNHALGLHEQFLKWDLLASNLTRLTSKFTRGQQQPKRMLKFVFWSTQAAFLSAIKHGQMHLQGKNKISCLARSSAALVVNGLLTPPVNLPCLLPRSHCSVRASCAHAKWDCLAHTLLWWRLRKKHNSSCQSSAPLSPNHVYFALIYRFFGRALCKIVDWFLFFQRSAIFFFFFCKLLKCRNLHLVQRW